MLSTADATVSTGKPTLKHEGAIMDTNSWHSDTIARFKKLPAEALIYIRDDAYTAAQVGETIDNPKTGQYWDEFHYASQELRRRGITMVSFKN